MKIIWTEEILKKLKNELLFADLERKLDKIKRVSNPLYGELSELESILFGNMCIQGDKNLVLKETKNCEEYLFTIDGYGIWSVKLLYEKGNIKALEYIYLFEPLSLIGKVPMFLKQPRNYYIRECFFATPEKYILKFYHAKRENLEFALFHKIPRGVRRYEKDLLRSSLIYNKYGILESRSYNLNGKEHTESFKNGHFIDVDISRNQFEKQYKNALALTKERKQ